VLKVGGYVYKSKLFVAFFYLLGHFIFRTIKSYDDLKSSYDWQTGICPRWIRRHANCFLNCTRWIRRHANCFRRWTPNFFCSVQHFPRWAPNFRSSHPSIKRCETNFFRVCENLQFLFIQQHQPIKPI